MQIDARLTPLALTIHFDDKEIPPLEADSAGLDELAGMERQLIRAMADHALWQPLGRGGNRLELSFNRPVPDILATDGAETLPRFEDEAPPGATTGICDSPCR